jgi:hypothetical protein
MDLHQHDIRSQIDQESNLIHLNIIQDVLEESIGSYALQNPENIYDEEYQQIMRYFEFSRGLKNHQIFLTPDGFIRWLSPKFPGSLIREIHNSLLDFEVLNEPDGVSL